MDRILRGYRWIVPVGSIPPYPPPFPKFVVHCLESQQSYIPGPQCQTSFSASRVLRGLVKRLQAEATAARLPNLRDPWNSSAAPQGELFQDVKSRQT